MRICIYRRDAERAEAVRMTLHACGKHHVVGCFGTENVDLFTLRATRADVFVLDCAMFRMDGVQLAWALAPAPCVLIAPGGVVRAPKNAVCIEKLSQLEETLAQMAQRELPKSLRKAIERELLDLGFRPQTRGFAQLRRSLELVLAEEEVLNDVQSRVYAPVAKACGCSVACVERNVRYAIECAWVRGDLTVLQRRFGYTIDKERGKPTNRAVLAQISEHIRLTRA